jgi:uncharacterized protein (TIGR04562 family)
MGSAELEALRLVLRGGSVVDWKRLEFRDAAEVDRFLRLNLFDLEDPRDDRRVHYILDQAVEYLRTEFGYRVAAPVAHPPLRDLPDRLRFIEPQGRRTLRRIEGDARHPPSQAARVAVPHGDPRGGSR